MVLALIIALLTAGCGTPLIDGDTKSPSQPGSDQRSPLTGLLAACDGFFTATDEHSCLMFGPISDRLTPIMVGAESGRVCIPSSYHLPEDIVPNGLGTMAWTDSHLWFCGGETTRPDSPAAKHIFRLDLNDQRIDRLDLNCLGVSHDAGRFWVDKNVGFGVLHAYDSWDDLVLGRLSDEFVASNNHVAFDIYQSRLYSSWTFAGETFVDDLSAKMPLDSILLSPDKDLRVDGFSVPSSNTLVVLSNRNQGRDEWALHHFNRLGEQSVGVSLKDIGASMPFWRGLECKALP